MGQHQDYQATADDSATIKELLGESYNEHDVSYADENDAEVNEIVEGDEENENAEEDSSVENEDSSVENEAEADVSKVYRFFELLAGRADALHLLVRLMQVNLSCLIEG